MDLDKYYKWWFDDYNSLDGRLRTVFYILLFYLGYKSLFPRAIDRLAACPDSYFEAAGLMQFLIPASVTAQGLASLLFYSQYVIIFFWLCAAIGLFGRIAPAVTGAGVFLFWGAMQSCAGTGHDWYLPMYTLIFLGLFSKNDKWSADYWLSKKIKWYPFRDFSPNKYGGLARKLVLLTTVFILFAGGIAKLFIGGFEWLNGETLYYYLVEFNEPSTSVGPLLLDFFLDNRWIITILAVWTVILELSSVSILFLKKWRLFYVINLWAFHIGIWLLMFPRYFPSMICYLLIVNWRYTFNLFIRGYENLLQKIPLYRILSPHLAVYGSVREMIRRKTAFQRLVFPSALSGIFVITIFFRIETFPFTHVPMYSTILTEEKIGNYNRSDFTNRETLLKIAEQYAQGENPWYLKFYYPRNIEIRLWYREHPNSDIHVKDVTEDYTELIRNWTKWSQVVTEVTLHDMSNNHLFAPPGSETALSESRTEKILSEISSVLSNKGGYDYIEEVALVYHFDDENEEIMMQVK